MRTKKLALGAVSLLAAAIAWAQPTTARADYQVFVGYSDGLRGAGFFPSPWGGDPGVIFQGTPVAAGNFDAGAIGILNTGAAAITVDSVALNNDGYTGWAPAWTFPVVIAPGDFLILTQTSYYDFDTSDIPTVSGASPAHPVTDCSVICPIVTVSVDSVSTDYKDTTHVLDTEGFDFASIGNESFRWRPIGDFSCTGPDCGGGVGKSVPGPVVGAGLPGLLAGFGAMLAWYRRKRTAAV